MNGSGDAMTTGLNTKCVLELGREYWEANQVDRRLALSQLAVIAVGHRQRVEQIIAELAKLR